MSEPCEKCGCDGSVEAKTVADLARAIYERVAEARDAQDAPDTRGENWPIEANVLDDALAAIRSVCTEQGIELSEG